MTSTDLDPDRSRVSRILAHWREGRCGVGHCGGCVALRVGVQLRVWQSAQAAWRRRQPAEGEVR